MYTYDQPIVLRSKVVPQKAHLLEVTLIPAKYETNWLHSKGTIGPKRRVKIYARVMVSRSKGNQKSYPKKAHLLDMTCIPAKYEIDGLHNQGTVDHKRK